MRGLRALCWLCRSPGSTDDVDEAVPLSKPRGLRSPQKARRRAAPIRAMAPFGRPSGFTLIEALIALFLIMAVLGAVATLFVQGRRLVEESGRITQATRLAGSILEMLELRPYSDLYARYGRTDLDAAFEVSTLTDPDAGTWQPMIASQIPEGWGLVRVDPIGGPTFHDSKGIRLQVSVKWPSGPERASVRQVTLVAVRF